MKYLTYRDAIVVMMGFWVASLAHAVFTGQVSAWLIALPFEMAMLAVAIGVIEWKKQPS